MSNTPARIHTVDDVATREVSRRQLMKAGAWAAPAILLTTATPAASASGDRSVQIVSVTSNQTNPWNNLAVEVKNNNAVESVTVTIALTASTGITLGNPTTQTLSITPGATVTFSEFGSISAGNNGNGRTLTATARVPEGWSSTANTVAIRGGRVIPAS